MDLPEIAAAFEEAQSIWNTAVQAYESGKAALSAPDAATLQTQLTEIRAKRRADFDRIDAELAAASQQS